MPITARCVECFNTVKVPIEGDNLLNSGPFHQRRMVCVRERDVEVYVELEYPAIEPLIW